VLAHAAVDRQALQDRDKQIEALRAQLGAEARRFTKAERQWTKRADRPVAEVRIEARRGDAVLVCGEPPRVPGGRVKKAESAIDAARRIFESATGAAPQGLVQGELRELLTDHRHAWVLVFEAEPPVEGTYVPMHTLVERG